MTLSIRDPETDRLARDLAERTGKSISAVVKDALVDYAARAPRPSKEEKMRNITRILAEFDKLPILDPRSSKEIMDDLYDEHGLPK